jgi:hypothetical protein
MTKQEKLAAIPARTPEDKPFKIGETLTLFEAAMVYAGRHPHERFFEVDEGNVEDVKGMLQLGFSQPQSRVSGEPRCAQKSWDIYCTLLENIEQGKIQPVRRAYDQTGALDPGRTTIRTCDLAALAAERGDGSKYLKHLLPREAIRSAEDKKDTTIMVPKARARPALERAQRGLKEIYPCGIPKMSIESNKEVCREAADWLKRNDLRPVSLATILRAAGRRR